jgi:hypothetical protein
MSIGVFSDKDQRPTTRQVLHALGSRRPLWERLTHFISDNYQMPGALSFGGKKYGWNVWYRKGGKTLVTLYPQQAYFVAQIVLGKDQAERALHLKLGANARRVIEDAPQLHDGRWLFIKVRSERDVKDVEQLLQTKKRPPRQKAA